MLTCSLGFVSMNWAGNQKYEKNLHHAGGAIARGLEWKFSFANVGGTIVIKKAFINLVSLFPSPPPGYFPFFS